MSGAIVNRDRAGSPALIKRAKPYGINLLGFFATPTYHMFYSCIQCSEDI